MLDKLLHLAAPLANQANHYHLCLGLARDHAQQHTLAHPAAGKQPYALALTQGQQAIDRPYAHIQRLAHRLALERVDPGQLDLQGVAPAELAQIVHRFAQTIDHSP